ncbi:hypothetical protein BC940DRAFT_319574 [Gongronella butleri]|nr:hypothetical protein BC940DRAFT_319574 [Gongronella butleri]
MVKFELIYFYDGGRCSPIRDILNYVGADWTETNPDWPSGMADTPYDFVALLNVTEDNGEKHQVAEAYNIEPYLARRFNLYPHDWHKDGSPHVQIYGQIVDLWSEGGAGVVFFPESQEVYRGHFDKVLGQLVTNHEKWLKANGSCGHYHDNKTSLSDLILYSWVRFYHANGLAHQINARDTPEIWKVYENVKALPAIKDYDYEVKWQKSDEN